MTVKKIFNLERSGEGRVNVRGTVAYEDKGRTAAAKSSSPGPGIGDLKADLKLDGGFYIQTLMELLDVEERVEGFIEVKGEVKGPLNNIKGKGTALLRKGNLFEVDVDSLACGVSYADGTMSFTDGKGKLYNGSAAVTASISLPVVDYFTLDIGFSEVDSKPLFRLIGWDPGIQAGKVNGELTSAGEEFNPEGRFSYKSLSTGRDILGRIKDIKGGFKMEGPVISLKGLKLSTGRTDLGVNGTADIDKRALDLEGEVTTSDVTDVTLPYYNQVKGRGEFRGRITGSFDDPVLAGKIRLYNSGYENYFSGDIDADVVYRMKELEIKEMTARGGDAAYSLSGEIYFKKAKELFDLTGPEYRLRASMKNADLGKFARNFSPDFAGTGRLTADMKIGGSAERPQIGGEGTVEEASVYSVPIDSATFGWSYADRKLNFTKMKISRGKSALSADATVDTGGRFSFRATADKLLLSDLAAQEIKGEAVFRVSAEGHGTFDDPTIFLNARMMEGKLRGKPVGTGIITAAVKDKDISLKASLLNDKVQVIGKGRYEKEIPWDATVDIQTGRYDSLISAFLKDAPEDLILSLNGRISLHGDRRHVYAAAAIKQLILSMYGHSFTNEKEIGMDLADRQLTLDRVTLRSGNTSLNIDGSLVLGRQYNIVFEGSSSLSPFKSLSGRIALLRGDADFVLSITGSWENPQINGGVNLTSGSFGLKDYSHRLSAVEGYLYMDNDRVVLQRLSGKLGGGDVDITGIVYLKKFSLKRFYVEAAMTNITASVSGDFNINFGGNLLYKGTPESQIISGDLRINRARYKERVEWKSWLLKTKKVEKYKAEISDLEKAELNIKITGRDNIRIDNNVARAAVSADMLLRGTVYRPVLFGRLESREGTVYFRNNEFRILHASADFSDPNRINPVIEIASETLVKGYKIKMNLEGRIDHFNMSLSSDPVLKEMDILSLLTVGQTGGELKGLEGGIGAGEATSFVTGKLQDVLEERLRTITGLDRFQIDPYVSKTTGTVEPRVTVSKRLMSDKLFVTYTSSVGTAEEQIIRLEYFLSRNMSLVGVRDERGILGGDVKFRFEFK